MNVYFGNKKINRVYSGDKQLIVPTTEASVNVFQAEYLIVGEGGVAGELNEAVGGGGGGGGLLSGSVNLNYTRTYEVQVGRVSGVLDGEGASEFRGIPPTRASGIAIAGGYGGNNQNTGFRQGGDGGSGGGAAAAFFAQGGDGISGQGFDGGGCSGFDEPAGGGGGAAGVGTGGSLGSGPGAGGNGKQSAISGELKYYSGGGGGTYAPGFPAAVQFGANGLGAGAANYGGGARALGVNGTVEGGDGIVIIRYRAPQKATGGTITTDGDYIIHTFNKELDVVQNFITNPKGG
jgi:hypothetical protein